MLGTVLTISSTCRTVLSAFFYHHVLRYFRQRVLRYLPTSTFDEFPSLCPPHYFQRGRHLPSHYQSQLGWHHSVGGSSEQ